MVLVSFGKTILNRVRWKLVHNHFKLAKVASSLGVQVRPSLSLQSGKFNASEKEHHPESGHKNSKLWFLLLGVVVWTHALTKTDRYKQPKSTTVHYFENTRPYYSFQLSAFTLLLLVANRFTLHCYLVTWTWESLAIFLNKVKCSFRYSRLKIRAQPPQPCAIACYACISTDEIQGKDWTSLKTQ